MKKVETDKKCGTGLLKGLGRALSLSLSLSALWFACVSLVPPALYAEVPVKFTYQGNLRQAGFLVNGNRNMIFRIYSSSAVSPVVTDNLLWTSPSYNLHLSTGVFRVTLEPVLTNWQNGSLWMELQIEGNRMSPREEITSSPFAINSLMISGKRYTTAAAAPEGLSVGDLWMDTAHGAMKYWNGTAWMLSGSDDAVSISGKRYTTSSSAPTAVAIGELWIDTVSKNIRYWNGSAWVLFTDTDLPLEHAFTHYDGGSDPI